MTETNETLANETADEQSDAGLAEHEHSHEHSHEGHDHEHHDHQHGPTLNPQLMREVEVEVPADEVSKTYKTVIEALPEAGAHSRVSARARCRSR